MNKLLKDRIKWGIVVVAGLALSFFTSGDQAEEKHPAPNLNQARQDTTGLKEPLLQDLLSYLFP